MLTMFENKYCTTLNCINFVNNLRINNNFFFIVLLWEIK